MGMMNPQNSNRGLYAGQVLRPILYGDSVVGYADEQTGGIFSIIDVVEKRGVFEGGSLVDGVHQQVHQGGLHLTPPVASRGVNGDKEYAYYRNRELTGPVQRQAFSEQFNLAKPQPQLFDNTQTNNSSNNTSSAAGDETELAFLLDKSATQTFITVAFGVLLSGFLYNAFLLYFPKIETALGCPVQISTNNSHVSLAGLFESVGCLLVSNPAAAVFVLVWIPLASYWFLEGFRVTTVQKVRSDLRVIDISQRIGHLFGNDEHVNDAVANTGGDVDGDDVNVGDDSMDDLAEQLDAETRRLMRLIQLHQQRYQSPPVSL